MNNNKKHLVQCRVNLCKYIYNQAVQHLEKDQENWGKYIERLILQDHELLKKQNQKKLKKL